MFIWMKLKKYLAHIMQIVYSEYAIKVTQNRTALKESLQIKSQALAHKKVPELEYEK
jgi:hypothetical protein